MNARLNQNEAELGIAILPVALEMLADRHGLLDQEVQILRDLGGNAWEEGFHKNTYSMQNLKKEMEI